MKQKKTKIGQAFSYLESFVNLEKGKFRNREYKLDRMQKLLHLFGNPQFSCKTIHIAGSKGKGSTGMLIAKALAEAGFAVGLYTSPHVYSYKERITLLGPGDTVYKGNKAYIDGIEMIRNTLRAYDGNYEALGGPPTTFELLTLLAFLIFKKAACSWQILETGLGGRLDATNTVIPHICVITHIELEHTDILGTTLKEIAAEKAGIIKKNVPVVLQHQKPEVQNEITKKAALLEAPVIPAGDPQEINASVTPEGTKISLPQYPNSNAETEQFDCTIPMVGRVQAENAAAAYKAIKTVIPNIQNKIIAQGFSKAYLPARTQVISKAPPVILDGAHTPASIGLLLATFRELTPEKGVLIFGAVEGKNISEMAKILAPYFSLIIITTPGTFKSSNSKATAKAFQNTGSKTVIIEPSPEKALRKALDKTDSKLPILITGSFYLAGEFTPKTWKRANNNI